MPERSIIFNEDQAEDLRELIALTAIVQEWLHHADDAILDDLARFAYRSTYHPRSYAHWLTEDLASLSGRLHQAAARPQPATTSQNQDHMQAPPAPSPQATTRSADTQAGGLDTAASIGNQILPPLPGSSRSEA